MVLKSSVRHSLFKTLYRQPTIFSQFLKPNSKLPRILPIRCVGKSTRGYFQPRFAKKCILFGLINNCKLSTRGRTNVPASLADTELFYTSSFSHVRPFYVHAKPPNCAISRLSASLLLPVLILFIS